jgi:hypothetical protein
MKDRALFSLSTDQEAHLDAWSTVYVEAKIQQTLGITLSQFLRAPGKYLLNLWLGAPPKVAPLTPSWLKTSVTKKIIH